MEENVFLCKGMDLKLYRASESGDAKLLDEVLNEGTVDVLKEVTPRGDTALHTATFHRHTEVAVNLIRHALNDSEAGREFLKAQSTDRNSAFHVAAERGCVKILNELLEKDPDLACARNNDGETALFKAADNGYVAIVEELLNYTPEAFDRRADGQTPLHVAVSQLHTGVTVKLLEERGALVGKADAFQRTALHILALVPLQASSNSFVQLLSRIYSTDRNLERTGKMLLKRNKNMDKNMSLMYRVDANGQSALHLAAKVGNAPLIKVILSYGTDCAHISDHDGRTALHLAVENASEIYKKVGLFNLRAIISSLTLIRLINCSDKSGQTAIDIAIHKSEDDQQLFWGISDYLKRHGAHEKMLGSERREGSSSSTRPQSNWGVQMMSVNAALIATVAFAAAFTMPGDIDSDSSPPVPFLINVSVFKLFVIFDSLAFCSSLSTAVLLLFKDQQLDIIITIICNTGLWLAVTCIALTFGAAIHLVVARKCMWLAALVWIMVCYLPIGVMQILMRNKQFLFSEHARYWMGFAGMVLWLMVGIFVEVGIALYVVVAIIWFYIIMPQWKTIVRTLSWATNKWSEDD